MKEISKVRPAQDTQGLCSKTNNDLVSVEPHTQKKTNEKEMISFAGWSINDGVLMMGNLRMSS